MEYLAYRNGNFLLTAEQLMAGKRSQTEFEYAIKHGALGGYPGCIRIAANAIVFFEIMKSGVFRSVPLDSSAGKEIIAKAVSWKLRQ